MYVLSLGRWWMLRVVCSEGSMGESRIEIYRRFSSIGQVRQGDQMERRKRGREERKGDRMGGRVKHLTPELRVTEGYTGETVKYTRSYSLSLCLCTLML